MITESSTKKTAKVAVSLRADLVEWVDTKAHEMGLSRSGYLAMCITQYKQALEFQPQLNKLVDSLSNVMTGFANGTLSVEQAQMRLDVIDNEVAALQK